MAKQKKSNINFEPWVGENYEEGYKGKHILVLGESHYCKEELGEKGRCYPLCKMENMRDDCFLQTKSLVSNFMNNYEGERFQQTLLCFERAVIGKELNESERKEFWNSIIFYNYIQYSLPKPRVAPSPEHLKNAEIAFREILEKYMPDYIIVWGVRLYKELPPWEGSESIIRADEDSTEIWTYKINGKKIPAMKIIHPSCPNGKSWGHWHNFYKKFLNLSD